MDIKETKELVRFGMNLGNALQAAMEDNKIDFMDTIKFLPVLKDLKPAIDGIMSIPEELADLSNEEKEELMDFCKSEFDLEDDELEAKIEMGFDVGITLLHLALDLKK